MYYGYAAIIGIINTYLVLIMFEVYIHSLNPHYSRIR